MMPEPTEKPPLTLTLNNSDANASKKFPSNHIRTAKYTVLTFLPLNLLIQFRKISNFFFLLQFGVSLIPGATVLPPAAAAAPLVLVLAIAVTKDGYEEVQRHRADARANSHPVHIVRRVTDSATGETSVSLDVITSKELQVGDIIWIRHGEPIMADCLLVHSTYPDGIAYIDTASLDGETSVKMRKAAHFTMEHFGTKEAMMAVRDATVTIDAPSPSLARWKGFMVHAGEKVPLTLDQFLFRGSILRNTEGVLAAVLYAGVNTKMFLNLKQKPTKMSSLDTRLNKFVAIVFILNQLFIFILCGLAVWWTSNQKDHNPWYVMHHLDQQGIVLFFWRYLAYFVLLSFMIPISIFVTLELCKGFQVLWMVWDTKMTKYVGGEWRFCRPKTSNLNEQMSQVRYIFTDKTGTLTENKMNFYCGTVLSHYFVASTSHAVSALSMPPPLDGDGGLDPVRAKDFDTYLTALALCNNVIVFEGEGEDVGQKVYEAASPDETALVEAARRYGYKLFARTSKVICVEVHGSERKYDLLATLEFTSERKMMSIVLRGEDGKILMITKGADSEILKHIVRTNDAANHIPKAMEEATAMSKKGLRTLVVAQRELSEAVFNTWKAEVWDPATTAMENRDEKVHAACLALEQELVFVGTTGIEDQLQENVPQTIRFFMDAGIVVWMLTGDKRETAVTIAECSNLFDPETQRLHHIDVSMMSHDTDEEKEVAVNALKEQVDKGIRVCTRFEGKVAVVIDGVSLELATNRYQKQFFKLGQMCSSAICCRLTPLQKSQIVAMFQTYNNETALAIGDGANDVSMIQEGRVGIGIMGLEGSQAELASDYAIPSFQHLKRLMFVHGRYSYYRNAMCIEYSFYKNLALALLQIYYAYFAGFSGQTFIDPWILSMFNIFFGSLVPLFVAIFDKDAPEDLLERDFTLYRALSDAQPLYVDIKALGGWGLDVMLHSAIVFAISYDMMANSSMSYRSTSLQHDGTVAVVVLLMIIDLRAVTMVRYWNAFQVAGLLISIAVVAPFLLILSALTRGPDGLSTNMANVAHEVFASSVLYYHIVFVAAGCLAVLNISREYLMCLSGVGSYFNVQNVVAVSTPLARPGDEDEGAVSMPEMHAHHPGDLPSPPQSTPERFLATAPTGQSPQPLLSMQWGGAGARNGHS